MPTNRESANPTSPAAPDEEEVFVRKGLVAYQIADVAAPGSRCIPTNLEVHFPERLGGGSAATKINGEYEVSFGKKGQFSIMSLDAWIASIRIPLPHKEGACEWIETGRMQATLANFKIGKRLQAQFGELNTGHVDPYTGVARMTWGAMIHSPELYRLDIDAIPVLFSETGFMDLKTGSLRMASTGLILNEIFSGVVLFAINSKKPTCTLSVSVPNPLSNGANTITIARRPAAVVTVSLSGTSFPAGGALTIPGTVTTNAAGNATATLTLTGVPLGRTVSVRATAGGQVGIGGAKVL